MSVAHPGVGALGTVYLIHFARPLPHVSARGAKQHYLGWTTQLSRRLWAHAHRETSFVFRELKKHGITWCVVRTWPDRTRRQERQMKANAGKRYCPVCRENAKFDARFGPEDDIVAMVRG